MRGFLRYLVVSTLVLVVAFVVIPCAGQDMASAANTYAISVASDDPIGPLTVSRYGLAAGSITLAGADMAAGRRTLGITLDTALQAGDIVTLTITGAQPMIITDLAYWLVGDQGANDTAFDTTELDAIVSQAGALSGTGPYTLTFNITDDVATGTELLLVRSNTGGTATDPGYADDNTMEVPTFRFPQGSSGSLTIAAAIDRQGTAPKAALLFAPATTAQNNAAQDFDFAYVSQDDAIDTDLMTRLNKNDGVAPNLLYTLSTAAGALPTFQFDDVAGGTTGADVGAYADLGDLPNTAILYLTMTGNMSGVSRIWWDNDSDDVLDNNETFSINATSNVATWSMIANQVNSNAAENLYIEFNGTTTLSARQFNLMASLNVSGYTYSETQVIGNITWAGSRLVPSYLWADNDAYKHFVRLGLPGNPTTAADVRASYTVWVTVMLDLQKVVWVNAGSITPGSEMLIWGYDIADAVAAQGFARPTGRMNVEIIIPTLDTADDPGDELQLNATSIQKSPSGDRLIQIRMINHDGFAPVM